MSCEQDSLISIHRFDTNSIGIDQGEALLFSDFEHDGPMWANEGARLLTHKVRFSETFLKPPLVHVSMSMWDISNAATARMDIRAERITEIGFDIAFRTWRDTKIARVRASWMAVGAVAYEDNWAV